ncbi:S-adenosyl-L-methionine-dependent methyltransferase [Trichodelitschia bisporula]|uniref:Protein-lysine N-methyltransferase EFM4 n=1 Tax=Trichodelitschia bisporula TaxID=703511 RepID=A0A6G1HWW1_9PEZI|nr:S-adenosyl-L-methionine-dependent methyltransferase [Trichodelitschia bisporula]
MSDPPPPPPLAPSDLGTKDYWDATYARELANHAASPDDEGTVWFADAGAEEKVIELLEGMADEGVLVKDDGPGQPATSFVDLGTGNGHLLFALRDEGWNGVMLGVDYSPASVELARRIEVARREGGPAEDDEEDEDEETDDAGPVFPSGPPVVFAEHDILSPSPPSSLPAGGADVLLDKGTFDAITLNSSVDTGRTTGERYVSNIASLLQPTGRLVITSCNWTEAELRTWFERPGAGFAFERRVAYPTFTFGGQSGQSVVTAVFRRM